MIVLYRDSIDVADKVPDQALFEKGSDPLRRGPKYVENCLASKGSDHFSNRA